MTKRKQLHSPEQRLVDRGYQTLHTPRRCTECGRRFTQLHVTGRCMECMLIPWHTVQPDEAPASTCELEACGLNVKTSGILQQAGYRTVDQVESMSNSQILSILHLGLRSLDQIRESVERYRHRQLEHVEYHQAAQRWCPHCCQFVQVLSEKKPECVIHSCRRCGHTFGMEDKAE